MIADRRRGLVGTFRGQPAPSPGLTIAGAGVSGESWQLTAILHRQSKRPVKWGIGRLIEETRHNANVERLQRLLVVFGSISGK